MTAWSREYATIKRITHAGVREIRWERAKKAENWHNMRASLALAIQVNDGSAAADIIEQMIKEKHGIV